MEILRIKETTKTRGVGKSQHYEDISNGLFTSPVRITGRAVGWPRHECEAINSARVAGASDDEIRDLVKQLEERRSLHWAEVRQELGLNHKAAAKSARSNTQKK